MGILTEVPPPGTRHEAAGSSTSSGIPVLPHGAWVLCINLSDISPKLIPIYIIQKTASYGPNMTLLAPFSPSNVINACCLFFTWPALSAAQVVAGQITCKGNVAYPKQIPFV